VGYHRRMFTVQQREALLERMLALADDDERVVAGALVGSLAVDAGDRYSDVDLTFAVDDEAKVAVVLDGWTRTLIDELGAVYLADLTRGPTTYRVFLLPDALQLDLSMTPATEFRPAGPRFRLLFGKTTDETSEPSDQTDPAVGDLFIATPAVAGSIFGWGVIYALHARACIERGRTWQAEHYVGAVRDHALSSPASCTADRRRRLAATTICLLRSWSRSNGHTCFHRTTRRSGPPSPPRWRPS
jgi:hypothetical protein